MSGKTGIEWTDTTWNPLAGCEAVSAGCDRCYAARDASGRLSGTPTYRGLAVYGKFTGAVRLLPERLGQPLQWRKPRRVFVNSMSDLFYGEVPDEYVARVFAIMAAAPRHVFQVLTKRHGRMRALLSSPRWVDLLTGADEYPAAFRPNGQRYGIDIDPERPLPNVWLGVSVENQQWADLRIPALIDTPAAVRFLSCEPLLGPVDIDPYLFEPIGIDEVPGSALNDGAYACTSFVRRIGALGWVIAGGESGGGARPMHPEWPRALRDQCSRAGVPFLFKQWGEWRQTRADDPLGVKPRVHRFEDGRTVRRVGKGTAGRELDGRTWDEYPPARETVPA